MPEYELHYDDERDNFVNEAGETLAELLDEGEDVVSVVYNGSIEFVETVIGDAGEAADDVQEGVEGVLDEAQTEE